MAPDLTEIENYSKKYYYAPIYANPPSHETVRVQEFFINKDIITLEDRLFGAIDTENHHEIIGIESSTNEYAKARTGFFTDVVMY